MSLPQQTGMNISAVTADDMLMLSNDCLFGNGGAAISPEYGIYTSAYNQARRSPSIQFLKEFYNRYNQAATPKCDATTQTERETNKDPFILFHDIGVGTGDNDESVAGPSLERDNRYLLPGTDEHLEYIVSFLQNVCLVLMISVNICLFSVPPKTLRFIQIRRNSINYSNLKYVHKK